LFEQTPPGIKKDWKINELHLWNREQ